MRLRTTTAVFAGALALVLPTAGPSAADDGRDRDLGRIQYRFVDGEGRERGAQIRPAGQDTCYLLTGASERRPTVEVRNETRSRALLFRDRGCGGPAQRVLEPGESARGLRVVAVFLRPAGHEHGGRPGRGEGGQGDGGWDGREEQGRPGGEGGQEDGGRDWEGREDEGGGEGGQGDGGWDGREEQNRPDGASDAGAADEADATPDGAQADERAGGAGGGGAAGDLLSRILRSFG
ncbi:hypothetical protein ACFWUQ_17515 [Streptomyces sp. NPDC058662]|uniref:hypothetical protein n=1 Tax=Streptomyces sp. NPDC058662 TaxID=3346583 RepID=UPI00364E34D4